MEYVIMNMDDAKRIVKDDAIVLVAKHDLANPDYNIQFKKKSFGECHNIIEQAETVARVCDDFVSQLRIFSEYQKDPIKYEDIGNLHTILFHP